MYAFTPKKLYPSNGIFYKDDLNASWLNFLFFHFFYYTYYSSFPFLFPLQFFLYVMLVIHSTQQLLKKNIYTALYMYIIYKVVLRYFSLGKHCTSFLEINVLWNKRLCWWFWVHYSLLFFLVCWLFPSFFHFIFYLFVINAITSLFLKSTSTKESPFIKFVIHVTSQNFLFKFSTWNPVEKKTFHLLL